MDASFEVSDHERLGKIRVAKVNGEPFLCLTDMLKLLNIFAWESIVPKASANKFFFDNHVRDYGLLHRLPSGSRYLSMLCKQTQCV